MGSTKISTSQQAVCGKRAHTAYQINKFREKEWLSTTGKIHSEYKQNKQQFPALGREEVTGSQPEGEGKSQD